VSHLDLYISIMHGDVSIENEAKAVTSVMQFECIETYTRVIIIYSTFALKADVVHKFGQRFVRTGSVTVASRDDCVQQHCVIVQLHLRE
jgi:hypothetical protein